MAGQIYRISEKGITLIEALVSTAIVAIGFIAIFQMVSHGIVSSALFLSIGFLYEQTKSREIKTYSFLVKSMPTFSFLFIVIVLSSIGLPGTSGFIGELLSVLGVYKYNALFGFLVATGLILGAIYMLRLVREIIFTVDKDKILVLKDLIY